MAKLYREMTASTISDAFAKTVTFLDGWAYHPVYCWFRGVKNRDNLLQPGACWRSSYDETEALFDFASRGVAFGDVGEIDDWDTYYLAQHHGIPTRLLDWTESFVSALFFAFDGWDGNTTPAIWILQPSLLNETFLDWYGIMGPERHDEMSIFLPREIGGSRPQKVLDKDGYMYDNARPLAIYPKWNNGRIAAQQGMFTVHGRIGDPLPEQIAAVGKNPSEHITRISLTGFDPEKVYSELAMLGVRRSAIYPDMDNFVQELKSTQGW